MRAQRMMRVWLLSSLACLPILQRATPARAVELVGGYWPGDETDAKLKEADGKLLDLQRQRFKAIFGSDKAEADRLNKEFAEMQRERRDLLRASGRR